MTNEIPNLPSKFLPLWKKVLPLLKKGRPDDVNHAKEVVSLVLSYQNKIDFDLDVLIPVAMMHDIGHSAILPEHFKYVAGQEKIKNSKLVHMLAGAKIANDILTKLNYDKEKTKEIVDIISIHDADQLEGTDLNKVYNTQNKKIFHDMDAMDRYNERRLREVAERNPNKQKLIEEMEGLMKNIILPEFKALAKEGMDNLKKILS